MFVFYYDREEIFFGVAAPDKEVVFSPEFFSRAEDTTPRFFFLYEKEVCVPPRGGFFFPPPRLLFFWVGGPLLPPSFPPAKKGRLFFSVFFPTALGAPFYNVGGTPHPLLGAFFSPPPGFVYTPILGGPNPPPRILGLFGGSPPLCISPGGPFFFPF